MNPTYLKHKNAPDWHYHMWTEVLSKDPNMYPFTPKDPNEVVEVEEEALVPEVIYKAKHLYAGEFDILKIVEGEEDEIVDRIKGKDAAHARVAELNAELEE